MQEWRTYFSFLDGRGIFGGNQIPGLALGTPRNSDWYNKGNPGGILLSQLDAGISVRVPRSPIVEQFLKQYLSFEDMTFLFGWNKDVLWLNKDYIFGTNASKHILKIGL